MLSPRAFLCTAALALAAGCGSPLGPYGDSLRVSASFNGWSKGEQAPLLKWDGARYVNDKVRMPGDRVELRLPFSTSEQIAGTGVAAPVPSVVFAAPTVTKAIVIETPLAAYYALSFDPEKRQLRVDLASDAEADPKALPGGGVKLVQALRGSDLVSDDEQRQRAADLRAYLATPGAGTPLVGGENDAPGYTFLHFNGDQQAPVYLQGDFNEWGASDPTPLPTVLSGRLGYKARQTSATELLYAFVSGGARYQDPLNPEVIIHAGPLQPNLDNVIGGNQGLFDSQARQMGAFEPCARLHHLALPRTRGALREVFVYLPPNYDDKTRYPVLYVHDGQDALVLGRYKDSLDRAIGNCNGAGPGVIPRTIVVFVPAQSESAARLADFAPFADERFPDVRPQADDFMAFFTDVIMPTVEGRYAIDAQPGKRAMLGVDMAGAFTFYMAWKDAAGRFTRVASQSGRFGWGYSSADPTRQPFVDLIKTTDKSALLKRISLESLRGDSYQVTAANTALVSYFTQSPAYRSMVNLPDPQPVPGAASSPWPLWTGLNLQNTLQFLLGDLTN